MSEVKKPPETMPTSTEVRTMGLPGQAQHFTVAYHFADRDDPRNVGGPRGFPGKYKVTFVLARPGFSLVPEREHRFAGDKLRGDSHLAITKPAFTPPGNPDADQIRLYGETEDGQFVFTGLPNEKGFLGRIVSEPFDAASMNDAERKAYRAVASSLSNWSAHIDTPLYVYQVETTEVRTGNTQMSVTNPFWEVPFAVAPTAQLKPEFRGYAGLYREALNSNSYVYRFLCFFKIIEGILTRRARLGVEAKKTGASFSRPAEVLPSKPEEYVPWLNAIFPVRGEWDAMALDSIFRKGVVGRKIKYVIDNELYPLRVEIAHALFSESGEPTLYADELLHVERVNKWLPLTKCIARRMLKNEFPGEFLSYLREDGSIAPH